MTLLSLLLRLFRHQPKPACPGWRQETRTLHGCLVTALVGPKGVWFTFTRPGTRFDPRKN